MKKLYVLAKGNVFICSFACCLLMNGAFLVPIRSCQSSNAVMSSASQHRELVLGGFVSDVAYSPDGSMLAAGGFRQSVKLWSTRNWEVLHNLKHPGDVFEVTFSPSMNVLFTVTDDNGLSTVWVWDILSIGHRIGTYSETRSELRITATALSPDGKLLAIGLNTGVVRLLDVQNPKNLKVVRENLYSSDTGISSLSFSPNSRLLAIGGGKGISGPVDFGTFKVLDISTGQEVFKYMGLSIVYNLAFSPDGKKLAVAGAKNVKDETHLVLTIFSTNNWEQVQSLEGHYVGVGLDFSKDGRFLVSAFPNLPGARVVVTDLRKNRIVRSVNTHKAMTSLALSPNGKNVAFGDEEDTISIYSIE